MLRRLFKISSKPFTTILDNSRCFATSRPRTINPVLWYFVKPIAKVATMISARQLRVYWSRLGEGERRLLRASFASAHRHRVFFTVVTVSTTAIVVNYTAHRQATPITCRYRYIGFSQQQMHDISTALLEQMLEETADKRVIGHPQCHRVSRIAQRLLESNRELIDNTDEHFQWRIHIVKDDDENAFVLPTGDIFVYSGILKRVQNDDQLAFVLSHEMSHAILNHSAEQLSVTQALDVLLILVCAAMWAVLPTDLIALLGQWMNHKAVEIMLNLPFSRKLESEADEVGIHLMAKACYDVREASNFWSIMDLLQENHEKMPELLSTHPNHSNRASTLDSLVDQAIALRKSCDCSPLCKDDPRDDINFLKQMKHNAQ